MKAKVIESGQIIDVICDDYEFGHYYVVGDNGRLISDYYESDLEIIKEEDEIVNSIYENLWVVRNHSGRLLMFTEKPVRLTNIQRWDASIDPIPLLTKFPGIDLDMFKNLKWEDEPIRIRMILVNMNE